MIAHAVPSPRPDQRADEFVGRLLSDVAAAMSAALVVVGDRLGLYRALAGGGALTSVELADETGTHERYVREWLNAQTAAGYVSYEATTGRYYLPPEYASALADSESPTFALGGIQIAQAMFAAVDRAVQNFRTGEGMEWGEHAACLMEGSDRFLRGEYLAHLTSAWVPALEGVEALLRRGACVADVGCGLGTATLRLAREFPTSRFTGFDTHAPSIEVARARAARTGLADRVSFEVAAGTDFPGRDYDLITHFHALHLMGDPVAAARRVRTALAPHGTWMIVEPFAHERLEANINPVGRLFYAVSTMIGVPASLAHEGVALGAQASEAGLRSVAVEAGFSHFRRASATTLEMVFEARP
jgi:2-polyprenyl-3-methyl-5-hydroxy-6-metoxy-1,4-benzoquinol methylase